jgi:hypothetical protein
MAELHVSSGKARGGVTSTVAGRLLFWYLKFMAVSISRTRKKRGRPPTGAESVHLRLLPDQLAALDDWIKRQPDSPSRPEAIRRLMVNGLTAPAKKK